MISLIIGIIVVVAVFGYLLFLDFRIERLEKKDGA